MENITSWYRIRKNTREGDPLEQVKELAQLRYDTADKPPGFAVFRAWEYDNATPSEAYRLIYFSPVACSWCMALIRQLGGRESDAPSADMEGLAFVCGDEGFAHDLLK